MGTGYVYVLEQGESDFEAVYSSLQPKLFSSGQVWWFGWHPLRLELPQPFTAQSLDSIKQEPWETVRIFSEKAEVRLVSRAGQSHLVLLTEESIEEASWRLDGQYEVEDTVRVLRGEPPKTAGGATQELLEIAFPRSFNYGIAVPQNHEDHDSKVVIAHVKHYRDSEWRLQYTRYCQVEAKPRGDLEVKSYAT